MNDARRLRGVLIILFVAAATGRVHPQAADPLTPVRQLIFDARYGEAETAARTVLSASELEHGRESLPVADAIDVLVEALWRGGKVRAAETKALAERAVVIKETAVGLSHPGLGFSLTNLGNVLRLRGEFAAAGPPFERALTILEQALGPSHRDVARTLTFLAGLAADTGDLARARTLNERALAIREQQLPPGSPALAENLNNLGVILERTGDPAGARRYHDRALAIREAALGPSHPDVAASLNNLANISSDTGEYAAARALHERALAIREKALGPNHPDVAASLNNLSIAVRDLGDHTAAWWLLERVLSIWEVSFGPEHPSVGIAYHNLAALLLDLGDETGTRLLRERARRARAGPAEAAHLAASLHALVGIEPPLHGDPAARVLLQRALSIKEKALGPSHNSVAITLTSLASINRKLNRRDEVRPLYERALAIREKALGPQHPDVADTLDRLGEFLEETGEHAAAREIYERVLAMTEQVHGPDHPHAGVARQHLAEVLASAGDVTAALQMALDAERFGREHLREIGRVLPEREALMYAANRPIGLDIALSLLSRLDASAQATRAVWDALIRSRAVVLDEMASRQRSVAAAADANVSRLTTELTAAREHLARLLVRGPGPSRESYRRELENARRERDNAERALAERSLEFRQQQFEHRFGLDEMAAALPAGSAIIAFVRHEQHTSTETAAPASSYRAFVARSGDVNAPRVISLGAAATVDDEVAQWRKQMTAAAFAGGRGGTAAEAAERRAGMTLRTRIWDAIAPHLAGADRVFVVPDGSLHLVNFEALPAGAGQYLIEVAPPIHYLSAERDLALPDHATDGRGLLVVDSPVFDAPQAPARPAPSPDSTTAGGVVLRGAPADCGDLGWLRFDPLPGATAEADRIVEFFRRAPAPPRLRGTPEAANARTEAAVRLSGRAATEASFKRSAAGVRVLHLATHGFFLGSRCASPLATSEARNRGVATLANDSGNPLLLAGFALAGANRRRGTNAAAEDGILTAEEIAALDLRGVEWAVLSGCDTGVGEIRAGEGVFGLRRAFHIAGARTVIMSLWRVDDESTRRWMTTLYEQRFSRGAGTIDAVRRASLEQLRWRRRTGQSTHPFYWGGFIAAGSWQ
jgi:CHAT domain-containing protein/tetratricopeptide (TPR) repeat protein